MRCCAIMLFLFCGLLASCATPRNKAEKEKAPPPPPPPVAAEIIHVDPDFGFAILRCAVLPSAEKEAKVYRGDEIVGRLGLTGPVRPPFAAADILDGSPQIGDRVRP
jgi:hypothetical protein